MPRYRALALAIVLGLAGCAVPAAAAPLSPAQQDAIDAIARTQLGAQHVSGLTIAVGRNGKVLFARGYGLRDRAGHLAADANTVYDIGSITKQFTAAAVWLLAQRKQVDVDAPLSRYLPNVPHSRRITVLELLDQISGYREYLEDDALLESIENSTVKHHSMAYYAELGAHMPLEFPPGSKWGYSNTNYALLGLLIERVGGTSYWDFLRDDVLQSRLPSTTYLATSLPPGNDSSQGYSYAKGSYALVKPYDMSWGNAAGALASSASDLIAWDGLYFGSGIINDATRRAALAAPHNRPMVASKDVRNNIAQTYASGWVHGHSEGRKLLWHNGGVIGYRAMNLVYPDGLEVVVLTNATTADPEDIALEIARMLY
jgi:CubicO group peptidase (beta-lactamase class C family)